MTIPVVIGVFGLSGVGKSRLVRSFAERSPGTLHLQGNSLIKQGLTDKSVSSEELRLADKDRFHSNQLILIAMFELSITNHCGGIIFFDGHLLIDNGLMLLEVPHEVIAALRPVALIHVEAQPSLIAARRDSDALRVRPAREIDSLNAHQAYSRELCQNHARLLSIPMRSIDSDDLDGFDAFCHSILEQCQASKIDRK